MPGRKYESGSSYRYGFNGKENDNEVKGEGNQQDYGMRIYDPRLGKFLSEDPITKQYPELTPYQFASNSPIKFIDRDGLERWNPQALTPTGITFLSKAVLPPGGIVDTKYSIKAGHYRLHGVTNDQGKQWWIARKDVTGGYQDDWIVGTDAVGLFKSLSGKLDWMAEWVDNSEQKGGGIWGGFKAAWNPQTVVAGLTIGLGGAVSLASTRVNLMGGKNSTLGKKYINYDKIAVDGIADDVANFSNHFGKSTLDEIVANNPQAAFLQSVNESLKAGGTITVRGQISNPFFKEIWEGKAKGMAGFEIVPGSKKSGLSTKGFKRNDGSNLQGGANSLFETVLRKKK